MQEFCQPGLSYLGEFVCLMEDHRELQLLPNTASATRLAAWRSDTSGSSISKVIESFEGPSLDLQLSISLQPVTKGSSDCVLRRPFREFNDTKIDLNCIEALKWQAAEQIRLAAVEKAYAEKVREMTRREMEMAQSEFARARYMWERAREEVEKAERLKEKATRQIDSTCMEITCQACRQSFRP
ncbi:hypothetical protein Scep_020987 [Stephania cephalantha]|uniref:Uncharacterized protein n=1 Tax=Stephania cephalantha TaxID=152367 RepID=A0AAP0HWF8_9MAGN